MNDWIREVVDGHPAVRSARRREAAGLAEVDTARWQYYPTPSVGYEVSVTDPAEPLRRGSGYVRLQQPIFTGGRLSHQVDRALADARASALAVEEERRALALRLVQALGDARAAALERRAYRESAASHVEFLALVQRRVAEGLSPRGDIVLARTRLAAVRADLEVSELRLDQALGRLEQMLGRPLEAFEYAALRADDVEDLSAGVAPASLVELTEAALRVSASVARGLEQLESARLAAELARARTVPELYVRAEHSRGQDGAARSQVLIGLSSNFAAGLSHRSALEAALRRVEAQEADVEARRRDVLEQVRSEHLALLSGERRIAVLADSANFSATVVQAWRRQFLAGRKTWQDLMNAAREKAQADAVLGSATAARWVSHHRLILSTELLDSFLARDAASGTTIAPAP